MSAILAWLVKILGPMILNWVIGGIKEMAAGYFKKYQAEKNNKEIKEGVLSAETDVERQAALDAAGRHLGRKP